MVDQTTQNQAISTNSPGDKGSQPLMTLPFVKRSLLLDAQAQLQTTEIRCQAMQDRLRALEAERDLYRDQAVANAEEARGALRLVADWLAEHQFGQRIFNTTAPSLPEVSPAGLLSAMQVAQTKMRGRDLVRAGEQRFKDQLLKEFQATGK